MGLNHVINQELLEENHRYRKLYDEHEALEKLIKKEASLPLVDTQKIKFLKRKKLILADQMHFFEQ